MKIDIREDDLLSEAVQTMLQKHHQSMAAQSPPESVHALSISELSDRNVTFWSAWINEELVGGGALKQLDGTHGEIKSMHTLEAVRGQGIAGRILRFIMEEARTRGYHRISLETGSMEEFAPARALYEKYGFRPSEPFADYTDDPSSVYLTLELVSQET